MTDLFSYAVVHSTDADTATDQPAAAAGQLKKRPFRTFSYRGVDLDKLLDMEMDDLLELFRARQRRKFQRGIKRKATTLMKKLRISKLKCPYGEKPEPVNTHLRDLVVVPEMIGSVVGVYNGKQFINVEIKVGHPSQTQEELNNVASHHKKFCSYLCCILGLQPEMVGYYLGEFSITYKPVSPGKPGIGATHSSRFIPLK
ncbi:UNVERIFIED_CONTAM: hypothetical protein H355_005458 [Colinus virginianus]|nr:hypothetical protein H355_005458 [Colinus virginianus]